MQKEPASPAPVSITEVANKNFRYPAQTLVPARFNGEKADVVIVGAGYTGLSAALHLAKEAHEAGTPLNVIVFEAGKVGSGASGKSCGHVNPGFQQHDTDIVLKHFPTPEKGRHILSVIDKGPALLEQIVRDNKIDCDLRKGYVILHEDGTQTVDDNSNTNMGIEPYPYVLGLAEAARKYGVKIYEDTPVKNIVDHGTHCEVRTPRGNVTADNMLCAGGHGMGETIPFLKSLRKRTVELRASTICTDPLPQDVIKALMPGANGKRYPFCDDETDVSYGTIDRENRMIFGAKTRVSVSSDAVVAAQLHKVFPNLKELYKKAAGKDLGYQRFVTGEPLNFTADFLPNVGRLGKQGRVRYVHALGGHGVALGTILGKIAADEITGKNTEDFSLLAGIRHMRLPAWKPLRLTAAFIGLAMEDAYNRFEKIVYGHKPPPRGLPAP